MKGAARNAAVGPTLCASLLDDDAGLRVGHLWSAQGDMALLRASL